MSKIISNLIEKGIYLLRSGAIANPVTSINVANNKELVVDTTKSAYPKIYLGNAETDDADTSLKGVFMDSEISSLKMRYSGLAGVLTYSGIDAHRAITNGKLANIKLNAVAKHIADNDIDACQFLTISLQVKNNNGILETIYESTTIEAESGATTGWGLSFSLDLGKLKITAVGDSTSWDIEVTSIVQI